MKIPSVCLCVVSLFAAAGRAGDVGTAALKLDLGGALRMSLAKNFSIESQRYVPRIALQSLRAELGAFDPTISFSARRQEKTQGDLFESGRHERFRLVTQGDVFGGGLSGRLPWGMTYDFGLKTTGAFRPSEGVADSFTSSADLIFRQPLLKGAGLDANLAQVRIARLNLQVSQWDLRQKVIDTLTQTVFVYNELYLAHENLRVAVRSRGLARQLLADNIRRAEVGVMSPLNITTARAEAAAREEFVLLAERQVKDNENFLKQLVTNDVERILRMRVEIAPPVAPRFEADVKGGIRVGLELRPDFRSALLEIERRKINLVYAKNQALPRLDLEASVGLLGVDGSYRGSVDRTLRRDQTDWSAGVVFSVPIPNREALAGAESARLASTRALVELKRLEQQVVVEVDNASGQVTTARERITSTGEARKLALESLEAGEERLRAGTGTTFEVLELQKRLAEAEAAELRARSDYNKAVAGYYRETGTSLKMYGVEVE